MKCGFLKNILIAFAAILFCCCLLELMLRILKTSPLYLIKNANPQPKLDVINSLRVKDIEHGLEKPVGTYRVVFVGDSYTEASGVQFNKGYSQVLTRMLNAQSKDQHYEALICAKWGYNSMDELHFYEKKCQQFDPDLIIVGYVLNDAEGYNAVKRWEFLNLLRIRKPDGVGALLYQYSHLFRFLYLKVEYFRIQNAWIKGYNAIYNDSSTFLETKQCFLEFKKLIIARNCKFLVVLFPYLDYKLNDANPFIKYYGIVLSFLLKNKIDVLDLFPYFKGMNNIELQVNAGYDDHPNEKGHRIIAKSLFDYLITHPQYLQHISPDERKQ